MTDDEINECIDGLLDATSGSTLPPAVRGVVAEEFERSVDVGTPGKV